MKKQICIFLCLIIAISLPNVAGLIVSNSMEIRNVTTDDDAPIWENGNSWSYKINRFQASFSATGIHIGLDSTIDNLTIMMVGYSESSYLMSLSGKIKGYFEYESGEGMVLKGNLLYTKISGNIDFRQSDLANEKASIVIKGIVILTDHPLQISIPIPVPLTITINVDQANPRPFIDFPLFDGKQGLINDTVISIDIKFESIFLQILSMFFSDIPNQIYYQVAYDVPMFDYLAESEDISVEAGTFNSYNIHFAQDLFGSLYYAPNVGNFIKSELVIEMPDQFMVLLLGELIGFNYQ